MGHIGIVARVATFLADRGASITDAAQYNDARSDIVVNLNQRKLAFQPQ